MFFSKWDFLYFLFLISQKNPQFLEKKRTFWILYVFKCLLCGYSLCRVSVAMVMGRGCGVFWCHGTESCQKLISKIHQLFNCKFITYIIRHSYGLLFGQFTIRVLCWGGRVIREWSVRGGSYPFSLKILLNAYTLMFMVLNDHHGVFLLKLNT